MARFHERFGSLPGGDVVHPRRRGLHPCHDDQRSAATDVALTAADGLATRRLVDRPRCRHTAVRVTSLVDAKTSFGQRTFGRLTKPDLKDRVNGYVTTLDATVKRIRDTIYQLQADIEPERTLTQRLADVIDEETAVAGLGVDTEFDGRLGDLQSRQLAEDIVAVTREALSNVARHARAAAVSIRIAITRPGHPYSQ